MSCDRFEQIISAALDGEAPEAELSELEVHLAGCEACRAYRDRQLEVDGALSSALAQWRQAVTAPAVPRPRSWAWAAAAAILVAALAGGSLLAGYHLGRSSAAGDVKVAREPRPREDVEPGLPGEYWVRESRPVPVADGLIWDRQKGLRSAKCFDERRVHTVKLPDGGELQWVTNDRTVKLVGLEE